MVLITRRDEAMKKIFFVDDNQNLCIIWKLLFERHGYDIQVFHDGESALEVIKNNGQPDIVITDFNLPGMDGVEFLNLVQQLYDIMPIILTGDKEKLLDNDHLPKNIILLSKPIQFEKIKTIIEQRGKDQESFAI